MIKYNEARLSLDELNTIKKSAINFILYCLNGTAREQDLSLLPVVLDFLTETF